MPQKKKKKKKEREKMKERERVRREEDYSFHYSIYHDQQREEKHAPNSMIASAVTTAHCPSKMISLAHNVDAFVKRSGKGKTASIPPPKESKSTYNQRSTPKNI